MQWQWQRRLSSLRLVGLSPPLPSSPLLPPSHLGVRSLSNREVQALIKELQCSTDDGGCSMMETVSLCARRRI